MVKIPYLSHVVLFTPHDSEDPTDAVLALRAMEADRALKVGADISYDAAYLAAREALKALARAQGRP